MMNVAHFANLLMIRENNGWMVFGSQVCCVFQDDWNLVKFRRSGTCEVRGSGRTSFRESRWMMIFGNKALRIWKKPSQRCHLKSPGLKCELVAVF
jgi:hypothetical protein